MYFSKVQLFLSFASSLLRPIFRIELQWLKINAVKASGERSIVGKELSFYNVDTCSSIDLQIHQKFFTEVPYVLGRPSSHSVERLQATFELIMSTFPKEKLRREEKNRKLYHRAVNYGVKSLGKEDIQ